MKLDSKDAAILNVLLRDGRKSLRDVAKETSLTTPTVSFRLSRMMKSGLIRKFAPVLDSSMTSRGVDAFITIRTRAGSTRRVSRKLASLGDASGVFVTTGRDNITLRVSFTNAKELEDFISTKLPRMVEGEVVSSQIVVEAVKDEQPPPVSLGISVPLKCDYCGGDVASDRPYNVRVGPTYYYFCCRTCRSAYLEKNASRITRYNAARTGRTS